MKLPGSRRTLRRTRVAVLSGGLVAATAIVFVHDTLAKFDSVRDALSFRVEWVGVVAAATLLFAALTIHLARLQWASDLYPYISWTRGQTKETRHGLDIPVGDALWCVDVANLGGGLAIVDHIVYDIELTGDPATRREQVPFDEMLKVLQSTGYLDGHDFVVADWQSGFGIKSGDLVPRIWEFQLPVARRIQTLNAYLHYTSRFGGLYRITLSCVPPRGLPPERVPPQRFEGQPSSSTAQQTL